MGPNGSQCVAIDGTNHAAASPVGVAEAVLAFLREHGERFLGTIPHPDYCPLASHPGALRFFVVSAPIRETQDVRPFDPSDARRGIRHKK